MFGGGETTTSLGRYTFPVYIMDNKNELHCVNLVMEIVEQDIIMLMGANSLKNGDAIIDIGKLTMSFPKLFQETQFNNGSFYYLSKKDLYNLLFTGKKLSITSGFLRFRPLYDEFLHIVKRRRL